MKIAILSDFHLGFGKNRRKNESFQQVFSAFKEALNHNPDLFLLQGDLFDESVPDQETWLEAFKLFSVTKNAKKADLSIFKQKNGEKQKIEFEGIPVVSIHGTHEFRGKDFANALSVLDQAGFMVYLHASEAIVSNENEILAIHGLGGVPEKKAKDVLQHYNPRPLEGMLNILLLHQSFKEFLPFDDEMIASLSLEDLPQNFDLIINGHFHADNEINNKNLRLLLPGSTVITQMKKNEANNPKKFFLYDTKTKTLEPIKIPGQRKFFYSELVFENASSEDVYKKVKKELETILKNPDKEPLIKLKLSGSLASGITSSDLDLSFVKLLNENAIIYVDKNFSDIKFKQKLENLRESHHKKSISSLGIELLEKHLDETNVKKNFDVRRMFELLSKGEKDKAIELLSDRKKSK